MIEEQNPWWISQELLLENEYYKKYLQSPNKWDPKIEEKLSLRPFSLNFIFGPRQVGKSTSLILLIKKLLDEKINPKSIFYFSCDKLADYKELDEVISMYLKFKKRERIKTSYIILDEVTFPKEWYRAIKFRIDKGDFNEDVLILSGSLSMEAKREIEAFPGRRGYGKTLIMLPLSFSSYIRIFGIDLPKGNLDFVLNNYFKYQAYLPKLNDLLELYLITGGFPNPIKDFIIEGKVRNATIFDFLSSIISDINKLKRSEKFFKLTVKAIIEKSSSEFSFQSISKEYGVGNVKTAISYVHLMEKLFILKVIEAIDVNDLRVLSRKQKKFYFIDPFVYSAFSKWTMSKALDESKLLEALVVSHLSRLFEVNYIKRDEELDITIRHGDELIGFEVKLGRVRKTLKVLGKMKKVFVLSKDTLDEGVIPVSLFLAMLDIPQFVEIMV
ncbi:MAG: ATP-binding protein [Thermoproteota archaeon]|jgi:predicted AAA+ superfamily ATPase|nr:ATP-binding protein [Thermoproteota archaeon]